MNRSRIIRSLLAAVVLSGFCIPVVAQSKPVPPGFDHRHKGVAAGKAHTVEYDSKTVGVRREMIIYTPSGYSTRSKYPVLYLMHGLGGNHTDWTKMGNAVAILDNLRAQKKIVPMIVVMPDNRASAHPNAGEDKQKEAKEYRRFEQDLLQDVIPFVESHYSVIAERKSRALAGLSMGGAQAAQYRPDTPRYVRLDRRLLGRSRHRQGGCAHPRSFGRREGIASPLDLLRRQGLRSMGT